MLLSFASFPYHSSGGDAAHFVMLPVPPKLHMLCPCDPSSVRLSRHPSRAISRWESAMEYASRRSKLALSVTSSLPTLIAYHHYH